LGALLSLVGLGLGAALSGLLRLKPIEGTEWAILFLPVWILFSGSSAIFARYLVWRLLGNQILVAVGAGAAGAMVGDSLVLLILIRLFTTGPYFPHASIAMDATIGALVAGGLAWAERKIPHGYCDVADRTSADDVKEE
jgi:hypothetical protein